MSALPTPLDLRAASVMSMRTDTGAPILIAGVQGGLEPDVRGLLEAPLRRPGGRSRWQPEWRDEELRDVVLVSRLDAAPEEIRVRFDLHANARPLGCLPERTLITTQRQFRLAGRLRRFWHGVLLPAAPGDLLSELIA